MKARLHPTPAMQKAIDAYAEAKIQGIQCRVQEAVMKERNDIATRATYLCLLACYQVGLSPRTLKRIQDAMTSPVADKYNEYRKYRELIPHYDDWIWTATPWWCSYKDSVLGRAYSVRVVSTAGNFNRGSACYGNSVVPACILNPKSLNLRQSMAYVEEVAE